jgi:hypothetical protein
VDACAEAPCEYQNQALVSSEEIMDLMTTIDPMLLEYLSSIEMSQNKGLGIFNSANSGGFSAVRLSCFSYRMFVNRIVFAVRTRPSGDI